MPRALDAEAAPDVLSYRSIVRRGKGGRGPHGPRPRVLADGSPGRLTARRAERSVAWALRPGRRRSGEVVFNLGRPGRIRSFSFS